MTTQEAARAERRPIDREALLAKYRAERDKRIRPDGNASAYFRYIDAWRSSGAFEGLEFR